jgi:hypothetical protein
VPVRRHVTQRLLVWVGVAAPLLVAGVTVSGIRAAPPRLLVVPGSPVVGQRTVIELRGAAKPPVYAIVQHAVVPGVTRVRLRRMDARLWRGTFVFGVEGRWTVGARGASRVVTAHLPSATTFAPPGEPGCAPPSPANRGSHEVRGSGGLWAQAGVTALHAAVLDGVLGKQTKIVWKMSGSGDLSLVATAPDGSLVTPDWLDVHGRSTWTRPGDEWGSGFTFTQSGCWNVHAERGGATGDVWLVVRS